jgi:hypothetical protein
MTTHQHAALQVGSPVWKFDHNRRRYTEPVPGRGFGSLIYREQWAPFVIIGETPRSWIVGHPNSKIEVAKLAKADCRNGACPRGWALNKQQVDEDEWIHVHRHRLVALLQSSTNYAMLREIARIAGYDDTKNQ